MELSTERAPAAAAAWRSRCLRCGRVTALDDRVIGCERCAAQGFGVPMVPIRDRAIAPDKPGPAPAGRGAMWRWAELLVPSGERSAWARAALRWCGWSGPGCRAGSY